MASVQTNVYPSDKDFPHSKPGLFNLPTGHLETVEVILKNEKFHHMLKETGKRGETPLHRACESGKLGVIRLMAELAADKIEWNAKDHGGETGLTLACRNNRLDVVNCLLEVPSVDGTGLRNYDEGQLG